MKEKMENSGNFKMPKPNVGYYQITGKDKTNNYSRFYFIKKPNIIHRFFCRILLGWVWGDYEMK